MRIFVTVGNAVQPFDRMLRAVDGALGRHPGIFEGICQHGASAVRVRGLRAVASLGREEFDLEVARADVVVTHAGVGSVHGALRSGHTPIVFARRQGQGEHVDDHQAQLAQEFARGGRVMVAQNEAELCGHLETFLSGGRRCHGDPLGGSTAIAPEIRTAVERGRAGGATGWFGRTLLRVVGSFAPPLRTLLVPGRGRA